MRLAGLKVAVILTEDGRDVLGHVISDLPDSAALPVVIEETEDLGVWIRVEGGVEVHFIPLRWEYILLMDMTEQPERILGLKG